MGFEPDAQECGRIDRAYGEPHHFFPHFIGDGNPATFHEINWDLTGSLFPPNTSLLEKFQNLAEVVTPVATHDVSTMRLDALPTIKLQKCAVLAHDLLMSFDLAHLVFSALDRRNGCNLSPV
jgi:hypothetical protein